MGTQNTCPLTHGTTWQLSDCPFRCFSLLSLPSLSLPLSPPSPSPSLSLSLPSLKVLSVRDAQSLLKDEEDLVLAVYDYWLAKRLRLVRIFPPPSLFPFPLPLFSSSFLPPSLPPSKHLSKIPHISCSTLLLMWYHVWHSILV